MAVTHVKKEVPAEPELVKLELVGCKRYVQLHGPLYEAGVIYKFTSEQAAKILRLKDEDGRPLFDKYRPERHKKVVVLGPQEHDMSAENIADIVPVASQRLDIGDDSEIAGIIEDTDGVQV